MDTLPGSVRIVQQLLGTDPYHLHRRLQMAEERAETLRSRLRELDLLIARGWDVLDSVGANRPWTPIQGPRRPLTLHEAMAVVLESRSNAWSYPGRIAVDVARRGLYRRRDGMPATGRDVSARACAYPALFERYEYTIRLRGRSRDVPAVTDGLDGLDG